MLRLKKIFTIFLTVALILSAAMLNVCAQEETKAFMVEVAAVPTASAVSSYPAVFNCGQEITVRLSAGQNTGITSLMLFIDYDEEVLEVVDGKYKALNLFTPNDQLTSNFTSKGDGYFVFYSDGYPKVSTSKGVFAEITFIAKDVCALDTALTVTTYNDQDGFCTVQTVSGLVTVPFSSQSNSFSIHAIDKAEGTVTDPGCTDIGFTTYICHKCDANVVADVIEANGHKKGEAEKENIVQATCTEDGSYDSVVYCVTCLTELSREEMTVTALGHDNVNHPAKEATCTEKGWLEYNTCNRCGLSDYSEVPVKAHNFGNAQTVEPGYKTGGYTVHSCIDCLYEEKYDIVPGLTYIIGDVDGNEEVNSDDAVLLLYHTLLPEENPVNQKCDFNYDGTVDSDDAIYLLYHTLLPEQHPLSK